MGWSSHQYYHQASSSKRIRTAECSMVQSRSTPTLGRSEPIDCCVAQGAVGGGLATFAQRSPGRRGIEGGSPAVLLGSDTEQTETGANRPIRRSFRHQKFFRKMKLMDRSSRRCIHLEHILKLIVVFSCIAPVALLMVVGTETESANHGVDDMPWGASRRQLTWMASVFGHEKSNNDDDFQNSVPVTGADASQLRLSSRMFKNPFHEVPENYLLLDSADERSREHVSLLVGILSTCKNTDRRRGIRRTWMLLVPEEAWQAIFILGEECARIPEIQKEAEKYHDLLFLPVQESYSTIDTKVLGFVQFATRGAEWAAEAQQQLQSTNFKSSSGLWGGDAPDIIMKVDDDSFLRVELLLEQLKVWALLESYPQYDLLTVDDSYYPWSNLTVTSLYWGYPASTAGFLELYNLPQTHKWHVKHESAYTKVEIRTVPTSHQSSRLWGSPSLPGHSIEIEQIPEAITYGQGGGWVISLDVAWSITQAFDSNNFSIPFPSDGWLEDATIGVLIARTRSDVKFLPDDRFCTDGNNMDICTCAPNTLLYHHSSASNKLGNKATAGPYPLTALPNVMDFFFSNIVQESRGVNGYSDDPYDRFDLSGFHDVVESIMYTRKKKATTSGDGRFHDQAQEDGGHTASFSDPVAASGKGIGLCGAVDLNKDWGNKAHPLTSLPEKINNHRRNKKSDDKHKKKKKKTGHRNKVKQGAL